MTTIDPVSVVVPTYNRASLVGRAVESALACCGPGDELIVVDDGSIDDTRGALEPLLDRVRYVRVDRGGAGKARNRGIELARHDLVAFLDSDDEWMPAALEVKRALMQARRDLVFCFSDFASRTTSGLVDRQALRFWHKDRRTWSEILGPRIDRDEWLARGAPPVEIFVGNLYPAEMRANYVFTSTLLARKSAAGESLRFAEDLPTYEDWECYGRLARRGPAAYLAVETAWQHRHDGARLTDAGALDQTFARIRVLERVWGEDPSYLADHGREFRATLDEERQKHVKALLLEGRRAEAREMIRSAGASTLMRLAASLPISILRCGILARRLLQTIGSNRRTLVRSDTD